MAKPEKSIAPAYISYSYFIKFHNDLRETHVPDQIDRSVMTKASGSLQSAMMVSLRFLGFIGDDNVPTDVMKKYTQAADDERGPILKKVMTEAYSFVLANGFNLERATTQMVADKFREQGVSGSTASKAIAFFLSAARDAGIAVSPHIKPPAAPKPEKKLRKAQSVVDPAHDDPDDDEDDDADGKDRIELPIPHKGDAIITVPTGLTAADWSYIKKMLDLYLEQLHKAPDE